MEGGFVPLGFHLRLLFAARERLPGENLPPGVSGSGAPERGSRNRPQHQPHLPPRTTYTRVHAKPQLHLLVEHHERASLWPWYHDSFRLLAIKYLDTCSVESKLKCDGAP